MAILTLGAISRHTSHQYYHKTLHEDVYNIKLQYLRDTNTTTMPVMLHIGSCWGEPERAPHFIV